MKKLLFLLILVLSLWSCGTVVYDKYPSGYAYNSSYPIYYDYGYYNNYNYNYMWMNSWYGQHNMMQYNQGMRYNHNHNQYRKPVVPSKPHQYATPVLSSRRPIESDNAQHNRIAPSPQSNYNRTERAMPSSSNNQSYSSPSSSHSSSGTVNSSGRR